MGVIINKKIIEFAAKNSLNVVAQRGRDRIAKEVKFYTIYTEEGLLMVSINPDCSYEQFLEKIANNAIFEAERLYRDSEELRQTNEELCKELEFIRAER